MPASILYGKLKGFQADVEALGRHYASVIEPCPATPYFDHGAEYIGWAMTSRDGSIEDGVKQVNKRNAIVGGVGVIKAVKPTPLCTGAMMETLQKLSAAGLSHFRARVMRLRHQSSRMLFHRDAKQESWRLHVPIITNAESFFEWRLPGGRIERTHFPADGGAYFVRVDEEHRAVNASIAPRERVHLLMSLHHVPTMDMIDDAFVYQRAA